MRVDRSALQRRLPDKMDTEALSGISNSGSVERLTMSVVRYPGRASSAGANPPAGSPTPVRSFLVLVNGQYRKPCGHYLDVALTSSEKQSPQPNRRLFSGPKPGRSSTPTSFVGTDDPEQLTAWPFAPNLRLHYNLVL